MNLGLERKACIVTGGSRGIGRATARLLLGEGADVLLVARDEERLQEVVEDLRSEWGPSRTIEGLAADVTDPGAAQRIVDAGAEHLGGVDVLVNNAGTSSVRSLEELTDDDWRGQWELNVMAPMRLIGVAAPAMADSDGGRIVNVCLSAGKRTSPTNPAYTVTKAAELAMTQAFAEMWTPRGVAINALVPGATGSDLWLGPGGLADQAAAVRGTTREEAVSAQAARTPLGRLSEPEEVAAIAVLLCSTSVRSTAGGEWEVGFHS